MAAPSRHRSARPGRSSPPSHARAASLRPRRRQGHRVRRRRRKLPRQHVHGLLEHGAVARLPRVGQPAEGRALLDGAAPRRYGRAGRAPAPSSARRRRRQACRAPTGSPRGARPSATPRRLDLRRPRPAELVQQHDHGLRRPAEDLHLGVHVAGAGRVFAGVDEVEHDVGLVAHVAHRLLAAEERAVHVAVPDLGQEPADRVAAELQALEQPRAVAEARRVPQPQFVALRRVDQHVGVRGLGDVRRVAHFADVTPQQRARQRRLADVGVRDEAQGDQIADY